MQDQDRETIELIRKTLERAIKFVHIATDWHLDTVELDGEEVDSYTFANEIKEVIKKLDTL